MLRPIVIQYKGFKIGGSSIPMFMSGCEALGIVYRNGRTGSMIEVARIEGKIFERMKEAEAHGLELARARVGGSKMVGTIVAGLLIFS